MQNVTRFPVEKLASLICRIYVTTMKPGGTKGGDVLFYWGLGLVLIGFGVYLFLDSVRVVAGHGGAVSGMMRGMGMAGTVSNMLIFTPFFLGIGILFYDSKKKWAWILTGLGVLFIIVEVISRTRFHVNLKVTHMLLLLVLMASGTGLILRSYVMTKSDEEALEDKDTDKKD